MAERRAPPPVVVPENRYDLLEAGPDLWEPTIAVVIPVFDAADRLRRVLGALCRQSVPPHAVVVADDGSSQDIGAVAREYADRLPVRTVRQPHEGFGAGRARNLGVSACASDVILFIDGDCVADSRCVERHLAWHRKTSNLVVVGIRRHVDETSLEGLPDAGDAELRSRPGAMSAVGADDHRLRLYSKSRGLRVGDEVYRAVIAFNFSVTREAFEAVGGFDAAYRTWGGEDIELGWRLWNAGATIALDTGALVYHLVAPSESLRRHDDARRAWRIAQASAIPNRFYRPRGAAFYRVPRCSWLVFVETRDELMTCWPGIARSSYGDAEIITVGPPEAVAPLERIAGNERVTCLPEGDVAAAVRAARGEFLVLLDGRVCVNPRLVRRAIERMDERRRLSLVRGAYALPGAEPLRSFHDIERLDAAAGRGGLPLLAVVRRREVMKDLAAGGFDWPRLLKRCREGLCFEASDVPRAFAPLEVASRVGLPTTGAAGLRGALRGAWRRGRAAIRRG